MTFPSILTMVSMFTILFFYIILSSKRIKYIYGYEIYNPISYNLAIYLFTGLVGCIALILLPINENVNKMVDSYASYSLRIRVLLIMIYGFIIFLVPVYLRKYYWFNVKLFNIDSRISLTYLARLFITINLVTILIFFLFTRMNLFLSIFSEGLDVWGILELRSKLVESEKSLYFFRNILIDGFAWIYLLYLSQLNRNRSQFFILFILLALFFITSLTKIKLILFLLSILMIKTWNEKIYLGSFIKYGIIFFICLLGMWSLLVRNFDPIYLFSIYSEGLVGRILISEISALYAHLSIFGNYEEYIGFSSLSNTISNIYEIIPSPRSGRIVLETVSPSWVSSGIGGVYNTVFFGEAYANFGLVGILLSPIWVALVYVTIMKLSTTLSADFQKPFLIYIGLNLSMMSGFNDYLWNPYLLIIFIVLFFMSNYKNFTKILYSS